MSAPRSVAVPVALSAAASFAVVLTGCSGSDYQSCEAVPQDFCDRGFVCVDGDSGPECVSRSSSCETLPATLCKEGFACVDTVEDGPECREALKCSDVSNCPDNQKCIGVEYRDPYWADVGPICAPIKCEELEDDNFMPEVHRCSSVLKCRDDPEGFQCVPPTCAELTDPCDLPGVKCVDGPDGHDCVPKMCADYGDDRCDEYTKCQNTESGTVCVPKTCEDYGDGFCTDELTKCVNVGGWAVCEKKSCSEIEADGNSACDADEVCKDLKGAYTCEAKVCADFEEPPCAPNQWCSVNADGSAVCEDKQCGDAGVECAANENCTGVDEATGEAICEPKTCDETDCSALNFTGTCAVDGDGYAFCEEKQCSDVAACDPGQKCTGVNTQGGPICVGLKVCQGNRVTSNAEAEGCEIITGDLIHNEKETDGVTMLQELGGDLRIRHRTGAANGGTRHLRFPQLTTIGGNLVLDGFQRKLQTTNFSKLSHVGGDLIIEDWGKESGIALRSQSFPALQSVDGGIIIKDNSANNFTSLEFDVLETVGGDFNIEGNTKLRTLSTPVLQDVQGGIQVLNNPALTQQCTSVAADWPICGADVTKALRDDEN